MSGSATVKLDHEHYRPDRPAAGCIPSAAVPAITTGPIEQWRSDASLAMQLARGGASRRYCGITIMESSQRQAMISNDFLPSSPQIPDGPHARRPRPAPAGLGVVGRVGANRWPSAGLGCGRCLSPPASAIRLSPLARTEDLGAKASTTTVQVCVTQPKEQASGGPARCDLRTGK